MNLKTKKSVLTAYALLMLAVGICFAIYRTVLLKNHYDPYNFTLEAGSGSKFRILEYVLLFIAVIALTSVFFAKKTYFQLFSARSSTTSVCICAVCGFIFATIAIILPVYYYDVMFAFDTANSAVSLLKVASVISMLFVSLYFLLCASSNVIGGKKSKAALSLALPLFALFYLSCLYFDTTLMFHDTNRIMGQVAFISVLAFFLSETNIATGNGAYALHFATSLVCIVCVSAYILPILFLVAFWEMKAGPTFLIDFSSIGVLIYAVFSAFNAVRTLKEAK